MRNIVTANVLIASLTFAESSGGCNNAPEKPDIVRAHYAPNIAPKKCWQLGIAINGDDTKVQEICVSKEIFDKYKNGDEFHG